MCPPSLQINNLRRDVLFVWLFLQPAWSEDRHIASGLCQCWRWGVTENLILQTTRLLSSFSKIYAAIFLGSWDFLDIALFTIYDIQETGCGEERIVCSFYMPNYILFFCHHFQSCKTHLWTKVCFVLIVIFCIFYALYSVVLKNAILFTNLYHSWGTTNSFVLFSHMQDYQHLNIYLSSCNHMYTMYIPKWTFSHVFKTLQFSIWEQLIPINLRLPLCLLSHHKPCSGTFSTSIERVDCFALIISGR